jgi:uncharacterized phage protein gp47/JayE
MYEDRTYDNIMAEMMEDFGADVRTDEGSLAFNACAKQAAKLEDVYLDLDEVRSNLTPDTMDLDHLISYAPQVGIAYKYATPCVARGVFAQEIPSGTQFVCGDYTYTSGDLIPDTTYNYKLICDVEGTAPNTNTGELELEDYIDDFEGGSITEVLVPGTDDEDEEEFRQRIKGSYGTKSFGGNKADYQNYIDSLENVGACKPKRRTSDSPWINIWLLDSSLGVPSASIVSDVQEAVDPASTSGEGDGMAPICHHVRIIAATGLTVNVSAILTLDTGYTVDAVKDSIASAISAYLLTLRQAWEDNAFSSTVVRIAQVEARILTVTGVLDVSGTQLNGDDENLTLTFEKVPLMGEVTLSV